MDLPTRRGADVEWPMHLNPKRGRYEIQATVRIGDHIDTVVGHAEVGKTR